jgi:predicted transcriptional regulator
MQDSFIYEDFEKHLESMTTEVESQSSIAFGMLLDMLDDEFGIKVSIDSDNKDMIEDYNAVISSMSGFIIGWAMIGSIKKIGGAKG